MNKKSKIITTALLAMTVLLMLSIFYIGYMLTSSPEKSPSIAPKKAKAQSTGYSKIISLDTQGGLAENQLNPTINLNGSPTPLISITPSPTEIILANKNPTVTMTISTPSAAVTASASATPTKTRSLPKTGFITNAIVLFGVSALVIFVSFIF
ncbi:hypothetical protein HY041_00225 [Candidatus Roizmanbacteria bacterium]|nr:hypothetical protein [Candidatus Roizmanbacteria bacterium]